MEVDDATETLFSPFGGKIPQVTYGLPFPEACRKHVDTLFKASRVYIICSASLAKSTEALVSLQSALGSKVVGTRIGMKPHTLWSEILEIVKEARDVKADLLITLGAGSLTDGAKIVALALANDASTFDDLSSLYFDSPTKRAHIASPDVPIISIPTSLSAGEYSNMAGASHDYTHRKHSFQPPTRGPALVVLDAALSRTTPPSIWLSTGIRAVDHCVEALCSLQGKPAVDKTAEKGLRMLVPALLRCKHDESDIEARHLCQMGAIEAMKGVGQGVPMGASHGIGHQLGPLGVGHGETSCILLPAVCKFNASHNANPTQQRRVLAILWSDPETKRVLEDSWHLKQSQADLGDVLDAIIRELGLPRSLRDVGVDRSRIDRLAETSLFDRWVGTNPVPLREKAQVLQVLEMVVE
ncbi:hypothetical protein MMC20_006483 [Loxospora ochrophaea]|nr:hypothetical protein [Loxospora ochrophaea]